jgi:hypothetical protein
MNAHEPRIGSCLSECVLGRVRLTLTRDYPGDLSEGYSDPGTLKGLFIAGIADEVLPATNVPGGKTQ